MTPGADLPTLAHALAWRARRHPDVVALRCWTRDDVWTDVTYRDLHRRAAALSRLMRADRRAPALIALGSGPAYVTAIYACLMAGKPAIPFSLPELLTVQGRQAFANRARQIVADCGPDTVITSRSALAATDADLASELSARCRLLDADEVPSATEEAEPVTGVPADLALLQYTSGSTRRPRGVQVSQANLRHNVEAITGHLGTAEGESVTSWLPLYHDLGLIGAVLHPLWVGMTVHLLTPAAFLRRPTRWLDTVSRTRSVLTMAPDSAYALVTRRVARDHGTWDLSSLRYAVNASEPVRPTTIDAVQRVLGPSGFRPEAMLVAYGLAEHTLCVTAGEVDHRPEVASTPWDGRTVVGCGRPIAEDIAVAIVDSAGRRCGDGELGEVWVSSPSVAAGYRGEHPGTAFAGRIEGDRRHWLRTGDQGMLTDGTLYLAGRTDDLIVRHGVNHFLHDIEHTATTCHPAIQPAGAAAFVVDDGSPGGSATGDRLVLVLEMRTAAPPVVHDEVVHAARRAILAEHGLGLDDVTLVRRGQVPRTTSGKTRRQECARSWLAGELATAHREAALTAVGVAGGER